METTDETHEFNLLKGAYTESTYREHILLEPIEGTY